MAALAVKNIADRQCTFIILFAAGVVPATHFNDLIGAPQQRNLSCPRRLSIKMMTDASTVINTDILHGTARRPMELDDVVKELNAMNSWPDLDGSNNALSNTTIPLN